MDELGDLIGDDDEDMDRRGPESSAYVPPPPPPEHHHHHRKEPKEPKEPKKSKSKPEPAKWEGAPPTKGGRGGGDATTTEGGTGYATGVDSTTFNPPAGHQANHVRARNAAQLTYPWHLPFLAHTSVSDSAVPDSFDWRTHGGGKDLLTPVQDQGACGCCWAFAATQSLSDRMRIASLGGKTVVPLLSTEYVKDCGTAALGARYNQLLDLGTHGTTGTCASGANLSMGCEFLANYGAVSSRVLPFSGETANGVDAGACLKPTANDILYTAKPGSVSVVTMGPNGHAPASHLDMISASLPASVISQNVVNMQKNIMLYGPLAVTFVCYMDLCTADFDSSTFVDGVYRPDVSSGVDGGHSVTIVGWGVGASQQTPYWIVRNSWGADWNSSMGGYYLHLRGSNAAQIESGGVSLQAGPLGGGGGRAVDGADLMQKERQRLEDVANAGFWQGLGNYQRAGLVTGVVAGAVLLVALIIALVVYWRDKKFGWLSA